ncbi:hypothetical protein [Paracoccus actinidiae]|jgi:hypothetical protein|uniref:hypothetical protein n=1 Tax=Paracoccus actinidiae TaxID=3064531 RepID=UPI0027D261DE|nr:hypothetical protein [Paracoccus sp. M09]
MLAQPRIDDILSIANQYFVRPISQDRRSSAEMIAGLGAVLLAKPKAIFSRNKTQTVLAWTVNRWATCRTTWETDRTSMEKDVA